MSTDPQGNPIRLSEDILAENLEVRTEWDSIIKCLRESCNQQFYIQLD